MKKLLALTLVLGLAAAASAVTVTADSLLVPEGTSISIIVSNDSDAAYSGYLEITDEVAASLTGVIGTGAGGLSSLTDPANTWPGTWGFVAAGFPDTPVPNANHFVFTYTALDGTSTVDINLYDENWDVPTQVLSIQNTPEPMTLGLLGLGGLFLRRRK